MGDSGVRLFDSLVGSTIYSGIQKGEVLTLKDITEINNQMAFVLAEAFRAGIAAPVHFQVCFPSRYA